MSTTRKIPVSFGPSSTSEYLNAIKGTKISIPKVEPLPPEEKDDPEADPEPVYVHRNILGSTRQFLKALKPVIFVGRIFGVIARGDVLDKQRSRKKVSPAQIVTACLAVFLLINAILMLRLNIIQFQKEKTTLVRTEGFCHSGYAWIMFFVYAYQLFATTRLRSIVKNFIKATEWSYLRNHEGPGTKWFSTFPRDCAIIVIFSMLLGLTENILYDVQQLGRFTGNGMSYWDIIKTTNLEKYYMQTFLHWHDIMSSSVSAVTMIFVVIIKLCTWGWVYIDTISIVLCRALWEKLRIMERSLVADLTAISKLRKFGQIPEIFVAGKIAKQVAPNQQPKLISRNLDDYQKEYLVIAELICEVQAYISPLILGNYMCNIYIIIVMLFHWIGPFAKNVQTHEQSAYVCFALVYFCYRIGVVTYFVAEVHQMSMLLKKQVQTCPNDLYSVAVDRLEKTLIGNPSGIHLFSSFAITRHNFVSIVAFVFTSEIILLQAYSGYVPTQQYG